ncbi:MAG: hypothetical protein AAGU27_01670 [Dehalobacterium sp.]
MSDDSLQGRIDFLIHLLTELKIFYEQSINKYVDIERSSGELYEKFFNEDKVSIQHEVDKYEANVQKAAQLNYEIMEQINRWYDFSKDPDEVKSLLFPIRFYINQRKLKKRIRQIYQEINHITLENRLTKEKLANWERELENKVLHQIKIGDNFERYMHLLDKKANLISDFEYLLSTLPVKHPINLNINDIDGFIENFKNIATAS